uniref:Uncharacterized protein n=1 Tax=Caldisericum exile TaxID=693075 RepID=A0A7C4Y4I5_9BACT
MKTKSLYTAIVIMVVVNFVMYFIVPLPTGVLVLYDDVWKTVAIALAAIFLLKAGHYVVGLEQKSLQLFASGFGCWTIGQIFWTKFHILHPEGSVPFPYISDIGFFAFHIFVLFGLFILLKHYLPFISTKQWLSTVIFFIILIGIAFPLVLLPSIRSVELTPLGKFLSFIYPLLDIVIIALLLPVIGLTAGGRIGQSWVIIVIGFALLTVADAIFSYLEMTGYSASFLAGSKFGFLWTLAGLIVMAGAIKFIEAHSK